MQAYKSWRALTRTPADGRRRGDGGHGGGQQERSDGATWGEHLRRILRGQASVFNWSNSTSFARTLSPQVLESQINAKKELEKILKTTCEEFIMSVTKLAMEPMLSLVTKASAVKVALSSSGQDRKSDSVLAKPLKSQPFAMPDKVADLIQKVGTAIQTNVVEAHLQLQTLLRAEYSEEEIRGVAMVSMPDLQTQLDKLL